MNEKPIYENPKMEFVYFSKEDVFCDDLDGVSGENNNEDSGWGGYYGGDEDDDDT